LFSARLPAREILAHAARRPHRCGRPVGLAARWADYRSLPYWLSLSEAKLGIAQPLFFCLRHIVTTKPELRRLLRTARHSHVAALPDSLRGLLFHRPPSPLLEHIGQDAVIGLYHAAPDEAPTAGYARFFHEAGHTLALPHFAARDGAMSFRRYTDPYADSDLAVGPFGLLQPEDAAEPITPSVLFVPLVGFTAAGERLGQGGGHYDRWLAEHPARLTIGLAWDVQLCDALPSEPHDMVLDAVVTPTRIYGN
jgi:5-formyltetrahydrofolate cyclo-ligase